MTNVQKYLKSLCCYEAHRYDENAQKKIIKNFVNWYVTIAEDYDFESGGINWLEDDNATGFELAVLTDVSDCVSPLTDWAEDYAKKALDAELKRRNS